MKEVAAKTTKISSTDASTNVGLMPVTTITIVTTSYGDNSNNNSVSLVKEIKEIKKVKEVKEQISSNNDAATTPNIPNIAINRVIAFLANMDKTVEERLAKWSKAKKLTLAASLCLVGLLGATFTAFSTVKDAVNTTTKSVKAVNSSEMEQSLAFLKMSKAKEILHTSDNNSSNNQNINASTSEVAESWQSIESLLASTRQRRKQALAKLGLRNNGDYVVAAISLGCDSCIRLAKEINANAANKVANNDVTNNEDKISKLEPDNKQYINQSLTTPVMMVTIASESEIKTWQREHLLSYPVQSISESMMNDLGIVFFPTLIKVSNGQILGVSQSSAVLANSIGKQPSGVKDNGK